MTRYRRRTGKSPKRYAGKAGSLNTNARYMAFLRALRRSALKARTTASGVPLLRRKTLYTKQGRRVSQYRRSAYTPFTVAKLQARASQKAKRKPFRKGVRSSHTRRGIKRHSATAKTREANEMAKFVGKYIKKNRTSGKMTRASARALFSRAVEAYKRTSAYKGSPGSPRKASRKKSTRPASRSSTTQRKSARLNPTPKPSPRRPARVRTSVSRYGYS